MKSFSLVNIVCCIILFAAFAAKADLRWLDQSTPTNNYGLVLESVLLDFSAKHVVAIFPGGNVFYFDFGGTGTEMGENAKAVYLNP